MHLSVKLNHLKHYFPTEDNNYPLIRLLLSLSYQFLSSIFTQCNVQYKHDN